MIWDYVVIGAGLAGSVCATQLARSGARVLVLESGNSDETPPRAPRGLAAPIIGKFIHSPDGSAPGRMDEMLHIETTSPKGRTATTRFPAYLGTGPGGTSRVYGAALGRMRPVDFDTDTGAHSGSQSLDNSWPVNWETFKPFYARAEALMRVCGQNDPTDPQDDAALITPPPLGPRDAAFADLLKANGRHPYRLHVGIDYLPGCAECLGSICPRNCKATGENRALAHALSSQDTLSGALTLQTNTTVEKILRKEGRLYIRTTQGATDIAASHVICAAGALNTPRLLGRSTDLWDGALPDMLGRGLMFHSVDMFAVSDPGKNPRFGPQKTLAFRDHYIEDGAPLGEVQSMGIPITTGTVANYLVQEAQRRGFGWLGPFLPLALRAPAAISVRHFAHAALFASNLEDFPLAQNRVLVGKDAPQSGIHIRYSVPAELEARAKSLRVLIKDAFAPAKVQFLSPPGMPNWGHPCGTCRMGTAPEHSLTDANGTLWDHGDITIVDGSLFPSSAGANPSLTIIANALRIADTLAHPQTGPS
jgi:choline dehydrogenase-like flavoprotein